MNVYVKNNLKVLKWHRIVALKKYGNRLFKNILHVLCVYDYRHVYYLYKYELNASLIFCVNLKGTPSSSKLVFIYWHVNEGVLNADPCTREEIGTQLLYESPYVHTSYFSVRDSVINYVYSLKNSTYIRV